MAETIRRVSIREITAVRVTCNHCKAAIEIPPIDLHKALDESRCRCCERNLAGTDFLPSKVLRDLGVALATASRSDAEISIEFPVKIDEVT